MASIDLFLCVSWVCLALLILVAALWPDSR